MARLVLAVAHAEVGRLAEPLGGGGVIGLAVVALGEEHGEIVHRSGVAVLRRLQIVASRPGVVSFDPNALLVIGAEPVLGWREALVGRFFEPLRGGLGVAYKTPAFGIANAQLILSGRVAARRQRLERRRCFLKRGGGSVDRADRRGVQLLAGRRFAAGFRRR